MFFLVFYTRSCEAVKRERVLIINGPDNGSDARKMFDILEPHAENVRAKQVNGALFGVLSTEPVAEIIEGRIPNPRSPFPFSNN